MIKAILACDESWGIGKDGGLPWPHNPSDMKWFRATTLHRTIVMGRNTWDSLPIKPLPGRHNIIVSGKMNITDNSSSIEVVRPDIYKSRIYTISAEQDVCVIGGAKLILDCIDLIDEFRLSRISGTYNCDTFLPSTLIEENFTLTESGRNDGVYVDVWSKL